MLYSSRSKLKAYRMRDRAGSVAYGGVLCGRELVGEVTPDVI